MKKKNINIIIFCVIFLFLTIGNPLAKTHLITPIPTKIKFNKKKALLGKALFFDPVLSKDRSISCASCHKFEEGGTVHVKFPIGVFGKIHHINSPTVFNAVFNFRQNWNGSAIDLKEQALMALKSPSEMGISESELEQRINSSGFYKKLFNEIYNTDKIKASQIVDAIAEFEKTLITPDSKFDLYLKGKTKLTKEELTGYTLFKNYGCVTCHNGVNIGGNSYQQIGVINPYLWNENIPDLYQLTHNPDDKCVLKVPTLRNIELTNPYFHDGSAKTLEEAVKEMAILNLGLDLTDKETDYIIKFLKTLTGKLFVFEKDNK